MTRQARRSPAEWREDQLVRYRLRQVGNCYTALRTDRSCPHEVLEAVQAVYAAYARHARRQALPLDAGDPLAESIAELRRADAGVDELLRRRGSRYERAGRYADVAALVTGDAAG